MTAGERDRARGRGPVDRRVLALSPALRSHLLVSVVVAGAVAGAVLAQAEWISRLLPRLVHGDATAAAPLVAALVAIGLTRGAAAAVVELSATRTLGATRADVRREVLDRLAQLRPSERDALGPARVGTLTTTSIDALEPWVRAYLPGLVLAVVVPVAAGLRIFGADPLSAIVLAVVVPLVPVFMILIGRATESHAATQWDALQRLSHRFLDALTGLPTLRLFGRADAQVERVREVTERYRQATLRTLRVAFLSALVLEVLATLSVALVAVSLGIRLTHGDLTLQTALVVLLLAPECLLPIRRVSAAFHAATAGVDAATDVAAAVALPIRAAGGAAVPPVGVLTAVELSVTDPRRGTRLRPVDLTVAPGRVVAVAGPSGVGKSTLLDALRGAIAPSTGRVHLGPVALAHLRAVDRAAAITWVPQRPQAFGPTVAESAAIGRRGGPAVGSAVERALEQVGLAASAGARPEELSGGELRRLGLARALVGVHLGTSRFLLLDEPTAQLDADSAGRVTTALRWAAASGVGVLVATHDERVLALADERVDLIAPDRCPALDALTAVDLPTDATGPRTRPCPAPGPATPGAAGPIEADDAAAVDGRGALGWLLAQARPFRRRFWAAQALGVTAEACTIGLAGTAAWLIVRAAERPSFADLAVAAVAVRAFGVGKGVLRYGERLASHDAALRFLAGLRSTVIGRLARLSPTGLPDGGRGDLLTRLVDDVDRLQDLFLRVLGPVVAALVVAAGAVLVATLLDPAAGLALAVAVVVTGVLLPAVAYRAARHRHSVTAAVRGALAATTVDLAEHVEELVACGGEPAWRASIEAQAVRLDRLERLQTRSTALVVAVAAGAPALATAGVVAAAGAAGPGLSGPALGVLVLLPLALLEVIGPLTSVGDVLARVAASAERVRALVGRPDPVVEPIHPAPPSGRADLDLDALAVAWPGGPVQVADVDLHVAEGSRAVITGPSGSGKSTLAAALVAFLTPTAGRYAVGGVAAAELGGDAVRRSVTWCQQDPWFADSTLADNLRVARPDATDDELWRVLAVTHLDEWAHRLPAGLATRLSRDAEAMSGGERQRLALARALLGGQRAIVLDEPTAHLDAATAAAVLHDLQAATAGRAVVVITHDTDAALLGPRHRLEPVAGGPSRWRIPTP